MDYLTLAQGAVIGVALLAIFNRFFIVSLRRSDPEGPPFRFYLPNFYRDGYFEIPSTEIGERILSSIMHRNSGPPGPQGKQPEKSESKQGTYI